MATTIKELIEYLQTLPEDTIISVIDAYKVHEAIEVPLDINDNIEYTDFSESAYDFIKETDKRYGKKFLTIGVI